LRVPRVFALAFAYYFGADALFPRWLGACMGRRVGGRDMRNICLVALAILSGACSQAASSSHDDGGAHRAGNGGSTGKGGAAAGTSGGAAGASGGATGGQGGAGGATSETISACLPATSTTPAFTAPCAVTCGNGQIDSCTYVTACPAGQACPSATFTEICDGDALGTSSCAGLGFSGGALRCGAWCGFDARGCDACARGTGVAGCVSAVPEVGRPMALALAANDQEIALAWLDGATDAERSGLRFARFHPDLSRLSLSDCFGPAAASQVALATTPTGWLLAVTAPDGAHVLALGPDGAPSGQDRLIPGAKDPLLVARSTAGPLLYWTATGKTFVVLLRSDGTEETDVAEIFPYAIDASAAVFTDDGFLIASRLAQLVITRIGADGRVASQMTIQSSLMPNGYAPGLAWSGSEAAVVYDVGDSVTSPSSTAWLRIGRDGTPAGAPTILGAFPSAPSPPPSASKRLASVGAQVIVLSRSDTAIEATKVDAAGVTVTPSFPVTHDPSFVRVTALAKRGSDVIAAWTTDGFRDPGNSPGRIGLARLAP
jgi:hypothetical protein